MFLAGIGLNALRRSLGDQGWNLKYNCAVIAVFVELSSCCLYREVEKLFLCLLVVIPVSLQL